MIKYKPLVVTGKSSFRKSFTCTNPTYASSDTFITILLPKVVMDWKVAFGKQMNFVHQQTKYIYILETILIDFLQKRLAAA